MQSERLLARLQVNSSVAFNVLSNADMMAFCRSLRSDFRLPYRRTLEKRLHDIFLDNTQKVEDKLHNRTVCSSIDGWEDPQHFHVLGVTARTMVYGAQPLLIQYDCQHERQSGAVVADAIIATVGLKLFFGFVVNVYVGDCE